MKIHGPSVGIGAAIAGIIVFAIFMVVPGVVNSADTAKTANNDNEKFQLSLLSDNASPVLGSKNAPITMVEFGDYQCFYCNQFYHTTEPDIVKNYVNTGKVKLVFKDLTIIGQDSINAAHAAHCAQEKGKFWEYHDMLYNNWNGENTGWASSKNLLAFATKVNITASDFSACMTNAKYISTVQGSVSDAHTLGLTGTPDFFIIGPDNSITKIVGAQPYASFDEIFKSILKT
ncbi:MAG: DsbA family protein [Nitrosopumilaceae archaeon]